MSEAPELASQFAVDKTIRLAGSVVTLPEFWHDLVVRVGINRVVRVCTPSRNVARRPVLRTQEQNIVRVAKSDLRRTAARTRHNDAPDDVANVENIDRPQLLADTTVHDLANVFDAVDKGTRTRCRAAERLERRTVLTDQKG